MPLGVGFPFIEPPPPSGGGGGGGPVHTPVYKVIVLTSASVSPWVVPSDWDSTHNSIQAIGAGGTFGGNGGDYAAAGGVSYIPGHTVKFFIGDGSTPNVSGTSPFVAPNTWFGSAVSAAAGYASLAGAQDGAGSSGGSVYRGGRGYTGATQAGGGAAGPAGAGANATASRGGAGDAGAGGVGMSAIVTTGQDGAELNVGGVYYGCGGGGFGSTRAGNYGGGGGSGNGGPGLIVITYLGIS